MKHLRLLREHFTLEQGQELFVGPCVVELTDQELVLNAHKLEDMIVEDDEIRGIQSEVTQQEKNVNDAKTELADKKKNASKEFFKEVKKKKDE